MSASFDQIRDELVSDDPSLARHKEQYLDLLSNLHQSKPPLEQDEAFSENLKSRLHAHLVSNKTAPSQVNRWQQLLLYGFPTLVLGIALVYIFPLQHFNPAPVVQPKSISGNMSQDQAALIQSVQIIEDDFSGETISVQPTALQEKTIRSDDVEESFQKRTVSEDIGDEKKEDNPTAHQASIMNADQSQDKSIQENSDAPSYHRSQSNNEWKIDYSISITTHDQGVRDIIFESGKLLITRCNRTFDLSQAERLRSGSDLRKVQASSLDNSTSLTNIFISLQDDVVTAIDGRDQLCNN